MKKRKKIRYIRKVKIIKKRQIKNLCPKYPLIQHPQPRDNTKITNNIFYHLLCVNDGLQRLERTYKKIVLSGLIDHVDNIFVNCVGEKKINNAKMLSNYNKVITNLGEHDKDESETLNILKDFCMKNPNGNVLYLHSKGASHQKKHKTNNLQSWIDCMEYFLIEQYEDCLKSLNDHDNCGIFFIPFARSVYGTFKHRFNSQYAGNFWWARCSYLCTRPNCKSENRWQSEYDFLQPALSKYKNLYPHPGRKSLYDIYTPRTLYTLKPPLVY